MPVKLIVINKLSPDKIKYLKDAVPGAVVEAYPTMKEAFPHAGDADAAALWGFMDARPLLAAAPHLRWVHSLSDGVEKLVSPEMTARPVTLTNSHGIHDKTVSEHVMALLLAWVHQIPEAVRNQDQHLWKRPHGGNLYGQTIAIIGFGGIGRAVAERAKAFGMRILAVKRRRSDELFADAVYSTAEIMDVLPKADVVVSALPATAETEGYFQKEHFAAMKKSALFINIARGSIVNEAALIEALQEKTIAAAALDVFAKEPLPSDSPLWDMKNVIITPHVASMAPDFWDKLLKLLRDNFISFSKGEPLMNVVDKEKGY